MRRLEVVHIASDNSTVCDRKTSFGGESSSQMGHGVHSLCFKMPEGTSNTIMWVCSWSMLLLCSAIQNVYMTQHVCFQDWNQLNGWWFGTFFIFPYIGRHFSQLTHVFQRGRSTTNQINGVITWFTPKGSQMIPGCHSLGWLHWGDLTMFPIFLNKFCGVKFQPYFCFFSILFQYFSYVLMFPIFEHMCRMRPLATSSSQKKRRFSISFARIRWWCWRCSIKYPIQYIIIKSYWMPLSDHKSYDMPQKPSEIHTKRHKKPSWIHGWCQDSPRKHSELWVVKKNVGHPNVWMEILM